MIVNLSELSSCWPLLYFILGENAKTTTVEPPATLGTEENCLCLIEPDVTFIAKNTVFTFYHKWTVSMTCRDYINHGSAIQIKISWSFFDFLVIHCRKNGRCREVIRDFAIPRRDGNENVKNNNKFTLVGKTTTLHVHLTFLYISLPLLHHFDVKLPNFTF